MVRLTVSWMAHYLLNSSLKFARDEHCSKQVQEVMFQAKQTSDISDLSEFSLDILI